ncbi:MAG: hypothetical protein OXU69_05095 [Gemmatimonadota bacterium]|nr:hypothetical protein [Gemmatimonadota bacterium]
MPNLTRRQALRATGAASLGLIAGGVGGRVNGLTGVGITQSVARWCFADIPLEPFCASVADLGLTAMDLLKVDEWSVAHDHGLTVSCGDVGAGTIEDGLNEPANHAAIIGAFEEHIPRAAREGVPNVICFFGNRRGMADGPAIENSIRCLRECAPIAESEGVSS